MLINQKYISNKCGITDLKSFSGHMQRDDLLEYYSNIISDKIYLVHSEMDIKICFANKLKEELGKKIKPTQLYASIKKQK